MPKYRMEVYQTVTQKRIVDIDAESEEQARSKAKDMLAGGFIDFSTSADETHVTQAGVSQSYGSVEDIEAWERHTEKVRHENVRRFLEEIDGEEWKDA